MIQLEGIQVCRWHLAAEPVTHRQCYKFCMGIPGIGTAVQRHNPAQLAANSPPIGLQELFLCHRCSMCGVDNVLIALSTLFEFNTSNRGLSSSTKDAVHQRLIDEKDSFLAYSRKSGIWENNMCFEKLTTIVVCSATPQCPN